MHHLPPAILAVSLAAASLAPAFAEAPTLPERQRRAVRALAPVQVPAHAVATVQAVTTPVADATPARPERPTQVAQAAQPVQRPAPVPRATAPAAPTAPPAETNGSGALKPCASVIVDPPTSLTLGKSQVVRLPFPVARMIIGGGGGSRGGRPTPAGPAGMPAPAGMAPAGETQDGVAEADAQLLSPTELFFIGRRTGSMNVVLQGNDGRCIVKDLVVAVDPGSLQAKLTELLPDETQVRVRGADHSLVLTGSVTDAVKLDQVLSVAGSFADGKKIVNLLRVTAPQQVMLEVKIAEVSKTLLDRFGIDFTRLVTSASGARTSIISGILGGQTGVLGQFNPNTAGGGIAGTAAGSVSSDIAAATAGVNTVSRGASLFGLDMQKRDGVFRVLAEPNIMAITGQQASFLSGGKIFIPVAQSRADGFATITLEEKEFGVGLKFTPTVLDGRINLKVISEVSELSQSGTPFTTAGGVTAVLPSMTTRRVDTTVQLADGQSFVVAGLIKNNFTEAMTKFPGLGETPVVGALFRSSEFQNDQTELMFVVTPRLVTPLVGRVPLPTDNHLVPSRADVVLHGRGESSQPAPVLPPPRPVGAPPPAVTTPAPAATRP